MPTYEYACRGCGEHVEVVQSFRDDPLTTCGLCGGSLRKVFSAAGIIFKGDGYYVTDSRKKETAASGGSKETAASGGSKDSAASGGSKDSSSSTSSSGDSPSSSDSGTVAESA